MSDTTEWTIERSPDAEEFYGDWFWVRPPGHAEEFAGNDTDPLILIYIPRDGEESAKRMAEKIATLLQEEGK